MLLQSASKISTQPGSTVKTERAFRNNTHVADNSPPPQGKVYRENQHHPHLHHIPGKYVYHICYGGQGYPGRPGHKTKTKEFKKF